MIEYMSSVKIEVTYSKCLLDRWAEQMLERYQKPHLDHTAPCGSTNAAGSSSRFLGSTGERSSPLTTVGLVFSKSLRSRLSPNSTRLSSCGTPLQ